MFDDDIDYELEAMRAEEAAKRRHARRGCQCGTDLPGTCPGPDNCPYSGDDEEGGDDD